MISKEKILEEFDKKLEELNNFFKNYYNKILKLNTFRLNKLRILNNLYNYVRNIYQTLIKEKEMKLAEYYRKLPKKNKKALIVGINYKNKSY